jgi:hypothetical protein
VIGGTDPYANVRKVNCESPKRGTLWQQDCEVIQAECGASSVRDARAGL